MKEYSNSSEFNNNDLIKLADKNVIEIRDLREAIKHIFSGEMEDLIKEKLNSQGIKTIFSTVSSQPDGEQTIHKNNWLSNGIACIASLNHLNKKR